MTIQYFCQVALLVCFGLTTIKYFLYDIHLDKHLKNNKSLAAALGFACIAISLFLNSKMGCFSLITGYPPHYWAQLTSIILVLWSMIVSICQNSWVRLTYSCLVYIPLSFGAGGYSLVF